MTMQYRKGEIVGYVALGNSGPASVPLPQRWFIRRVTPGRDAKVMRALILRNVCAWSPTIFRTIDRSSGSEARRPHLGRRVVKPFLPGLIFVPDFEISSRFMQAQDAIGDLEDWLWIADAPASLSIDDMAQLRRIVDALNTPRSQRQRKLAIGDLVRVVDGPLAYFVGRVERLDSHGRLKVFVDALMRGASVTLDQAQVEPA